MLTRTRSKTLSTAMPADSTSEDDFSSSQSQSASDITATPPSSLDPNPAMFDDNDAADSLLPDTITQQSAAATIHIHCPTLVTPSADAIDLTDEKMVERPVGWSESAVSESEVHVLPCEIHYNGVAAVSSYFQPSRVVNPLLSAASSSSADSVAALSRSPTSSPGTYISAEAPTASGQVSAMGSVTNGSSSSSGSTSAALASSSWYTAAFRGRELTGDKITLPSNTIGLVIKDKQQPHHSSAVRSNSSRGTSSSSSSSSSKRHRQSAAATATSDDCVMLPDADMPSNSSTGADDVEAVGMRIDWVVDGWFKDVTLWGRDADWKGADQSLLKRSLLDWPVVAAALHYVPPVDLPTSRIEFS